MVDKISDAAAKPMMSRRQMLHRTLLVGGVAALSGLSMSGAQAAEDSLVLYSGEHRETTEQLVAAFSKASGIKVTVRNGSSSELSNQLAEEGANSPADLFWSEQSPSIAALADKGLLASVDATTLAAVYPSFKATDGTWVGASARYRAVLYNKKMISDTDLPVHIMDYADAKWKDKLAYCVKDGFMEQVTAIMILEGKDKALDWLKALRANGRAYPGNGALVKAVEAGEMAFGLTNNYYWDTMAKEQGADTLNTALHLVAKGDPGALVNVTAAGILKSTKKLDLAQKFLAYAVSEEGQKTIVASIAEYPVRPGITSPFKLLSLNDYGQSKVTPGDIGAAADAFALSREAGLV